MSECSVLDARHDPPAVEAESVKLRAGALVLIRPIDPTDTILLADGFARLSDRSRWFRFFTAKQALSAAELRYFTDVDHHDHEALVALSVSDGRAVGVARYIRRANDPLSADIAVTVADDWQRRGVATHLLSRLGDCALRAGIIRFTVLVAAENAAVFAFLRSAGLDLRHRRVSFGTVEGEIDVPSRVAAASR